MKLTFRRHPIGSANHRLPFALLVGDLGTETKIGDFDRPIHPQ